jgi:hypothetical protein
MPAVALGSTTSTPAAPGGDERVGGVGGHLGASHVD